MGQLIERAAALFSRIPAGFALAFVFLLPALETAFILGIIVPGETAVVLGGVLASTGRVPLWAVAAASVLGAIAGDSVGYLLGRRYGEHAIRAKLGKRWDRAHSWLAKNGTLPIFLARFVPFVRTVLPITAGAIRVPARRFLPADFGAGVVWGVGSTLLGYFAGRDWRKALAVGNRLSIGLGVALAVALGLWLWRRRHPRRRKSTARRPRRARAKS